jgi:hypothetical protein
MKTLWVFDDTLPTENKIRQILDLNIVSIIEHQNDFK